MKLCKDCKYITNNHGSYPICSRPRYVELVNGNTIINEEYCLNERRHGFFKSILERTCGKYARYFERKESEE